MRTEVIDLVGELDGVFGHTLQGRSRIDVKDFPRAAEVDPDDHLTTVAVFDSDVDLGEIDLAAHGSFFLKSRNAWRVSQSMDSIRSMSYSLSSRLMSRISSEKRSSVPR